MSTATLLELRDYLYGTLSVDDMVWLGEELKDYVRKDKGVEPYTIEELHARIAKSERDAADGKLRAHDEVFENYLKEDFPEAV